MDNFSEKRAEYLLSLEDKFLQGGVILSEWCNFIVIEASNAFIAGANLAAILTSTAGIETYLRAEYSSKKEERFYFLIENSMLKEELKNKLHKLRKYRNQWTHIKDPWDDDSLLEYPDKVNKELEKMSYFAMNCLFEVIFDMPGI